MSAAIAAALQQARATMPANVMKSPGLGIELMWQTICQLGRKMRSYSRRVISGWL
jgi:hypothetical protein